MPGQSGKGRIPPRVLSLLFLPHVFSFPPADHPSFLRCFFPFFLILPPFFDAHMSDRLRFHLRRFLRIFSLFIFPKPLAKVCEAEFSVHRGQFDLNLSHENDRAGTFLLEPQPGTGQSFMQILPCAGVCNDGVSPFLSDALRRFLARGVFKVLRSGVGLDLFQLAVADNLAFFVDPVTGMVLAGPSLLVLNFRHNPVCRLDVESPVRLNHFFRVGMRPVHDNVDVEISRIAVRSDNSLMTFQAHALQKNIHRFLHLFMAGDFIFLP